MRNVERKGGGDFILLTSSRLVYLEEKGARDPSSMCDTAGKGAKSRAAAPKGKKGKERPPRNAGQPLQAKKKKNRLSRILR